MRQYIANMLIKSLLFAPANRQDLIAKFPRTHADAFVLDLEDAVPAADRPTARTSLPQAVNVARKGDRPHTIFVRINDARSADFERDVTAVKSCDVDGIVLPKAESAEDIAKLGALLGGARFISIIAGIESIRGVLDCVAIAAMAKVVAVYFGAEDFAADMGGRRTREADEVLYARSRVVLAAKAARVTAVDQAVVEVRDDDQFRRDAARGRDLGYDGKICLLPRQVELANEAFGPSEAEIDYARRLIAAYESAKSTGRGAIDFEGKMVDEPVLKHAQLILAAASRQ
jgi:citrate lyase subunit beta/citryl-CoA lyase